MATRPSGKRLVTSYSVAQYLSLQLTNHIANRVISANDPFTECSISIPTHQSSNAILINLPLTDEH